MSQDIQSQANLANYNKVINAIEEVSPQRKYQTMLFIFFLAIFFSLHFADSTNNFLFNNPVFVCGSDSDNIVEEEDACMIINTCIIQNAQSLTARLHLYCGQQTANRNFIKSMKGIGLWIGIALVGFGVNHFGKKPFIKAGVMFLNLWVLFLLLGSLLSNNILLVISLLFYGVGNSIIEVISFIYITRFLSKKSYEKLTVASFFAGSGVAQLVFGLVTSAIQNWFALLMIATVPIIILFALSFVLQEDPYYLLENQRIFECQEVIRFIGTMNQASEIKIEEQLIELGKIQIADQDINISFTQAFNIIKSNLEIVWLVIVLGLIYLTTHISEASFSFTAQEIGYSYQSNISALGVASIIGSLTFFFIISVQNKRKRGFIWTTTIEVLLSCLFLTPFIKDSKFLQVALLFCIRVLKDWSLNFFVRLKVDCLPKSYQTSLTTVIMLIGKTADVLGPHIIQYWSDHHFNVQVMNNGLQFLFGVCTLLFLITQKYHQVSFKTKHNHYQELPGKNQDIAEK